ncbi:MAG: hypothetical protein KC417_17880 [Myxococcales bacterium]|nr:hypothetical protein [Myxococcales bacterium]
MQRVTWTDICSREDLVGHWIALTECSYDDTGKACGGAFVDSDEDLVELCTRLGQQARSNCDIVFCSRRDHERVSMPPSFDRRSSYPPPPSLEQRR